MLDAHREPDQAVGGRKGRCRHGGVAHGGGIADQGLDPTEGLPQQEDFGPLDGPTGLLRRGYPEGDWL